VAGFHRRLRIFCCLGLCEFGVCFLISRTTGVGGGSKSGLFCSG